MLSEFGFRYPLYLLLLIPFAAAAVWYFAGKMRSRGSAAAVSSRAIVRQSRSIRAVTYPYLPVLRAAAVLLLIIAAASPGKKITHTTIKKSGIDIMIALDVSTSMRAEDFQPENRLLVAKKVIADFISRREGDRIGLVIFAREAYLQCPLTVEHEIILEILNEVDFDSVTADGTAIGDAVALSSSRLIEKNSAGKMILLLTDGMNNSGSIDPETAADASAGLGIKIYPVGIGKEGRVPFPRGGGIFGPSYVINQFDETALRNIAEKTGGKFYRAQSSGVLWENMSEINSLERSPAEVKKYQEFISGASELLALAAAFFFLEIFLRSAVYRKVP